MTKLDELLEDAIRALARMDAPALELLQERALELRALIQPQAPRGGGAASAETVARFRVFANVLRGTGQGMGVLTRMRGNDRGGAGRSGAWGR